MKRLIIISSIVMAGNLSIIAQSGTNSPYSQYGFGVLSEQSQGFNRGLNGLAIGLRDNNQVNVLNPASYSAIDSLTMIFDVGLSGQVVNFQENGKKINANNANFEYAVGAFRLLPNVGVGFGLIPFSSVGYNYSNIPNVTSNAISFTETHSGSGGFHQAFIGVGWKILKNISVGANFSYFWGSYDKSISIVSSDGYVNTQIKTYSTSVSNYKIDFGVQWQKQITNKDILTLGLTYGLGHNLNADATLTTQNTNSQTGVSSETSDIVSNALSIPHSFGAGLAWKHSEKITVGVDYTLQKWGELEFPEVNAQTGIYSLKNGILTDRNKFTIGCEFTPNSASKQFFNRVHYRIGASLATPYIKVNELDGPKEYSVSAGFGIPISNNRSIFNISGQWVRTSSMNFIKENTFRLNIGITFNERWFMKWKVE